MMKPKATTAAPVATPIRLSLHPSRPGLRRGEATDLDLLVRVHTPELPAARDGQGTSRPPLNLALVLHQGSDWR